MAPDTFDGRRFVTLPRRSAVILLALGALASATPALAHGEPMAAAAPSGSLARAVQWVKSCLPGGGEQAGSGSAWWTSQVVESEAPAVPLASQPPVVAGAGATTSTSPASGSGAPLSSGNGGFEAPSSPEATARASSQKRPVESVSGTAARSSTDVPEPGMIGLFAAGAIALALRRRATSAVRTGTPRRPAHLPGT